MKKYNTCLQYFIFKKKSEPQIPPPGCNLANNPNITDLTVKTNHSSINNQDTRLL